MTKPSIDEMLDICDSRYTLVSAVAQRARSIVEKETETFEENSGAISRDDIANEKPVTKAIREIYEGKYKIVIND